MGGRSNLARLGGEHAPARRRPRQQRRQLTAVARSPGLEKGASTEQQSTARGTGGHASSVMMTCRELWEIRWDQLHSASLQVDACAGHRRPTTGLAWRLSEDVNEQHQIILIHNGQQDQESRPRVNSGKLYCSARFQWRCSSWPLYRADSCAELGLSVEAACVAGDAALELHPTLVVLESALVGCVVTMAPLLLAVPWDAVH